MALSAVPGLECDLDAPALSSARCFFVARDVQRFLLRAVAVLQRQRRPLTLVDLRTHLRQYMDMPAHGPFPACARIFMPVFVGGRWCVQCASEVRGVPPAGPASQSVEAMSVSIAVLGEVNPTHGRALRPLTAMLSLQTRPHRRGVQRVLARVCCTVCKPHPRVPPGTATPLRNHSEWPRETLCDLVNKEFHRRAPRRRKHGDAT